MTDRFEKFIAHQDHRLADSAFRDIPNSDEVFARSERLRSRGGLLGPATGWKQIDALLYGLPPREVVVVAARPSVGKSMFACNLAINAAKSGAKIGFFSLEMSREEVVCRIVSAACEFSYRMIYTGSLIAADREKIDAMMPSEGLPIHICDKGSMTPEQILDHSRALKAKLGGLDAIIIDHLQIVADSKAGRGRYETMTHISGTLKPMAKELDTCVVALSQLRRLEKDQKNKQPELSDLRESGAIEQDAGAVLLLHREDYGDPNAPSQGETQVIVAKNRNGPIGQARLKHRMEIQKLDDV